MSPFQEATSQPPGQVATQPIDRSSTDWTRRRLLRQGIGLAGAALLAPAILGRGGGIVRAGHSRQSTAGELFVFESDATGFNTKTVFYDTGSMVVAFDTQFTPKDAEKALAFLREMTDRPLAYAVITHPNPDKFNGIPIFQRAGAQVVASRTTAAAIPGVHAYKKAYFVGAGVFTEETYPELGSVDRTFEGTHNLLVGGKGVALRELSHPGVSSTQTVALLLDADAMIVGDLVHHKAHAWLEGGIVDGTPTPTLDGWIADLNELRNLAADAGVPRAFSTPEPTVFGGRGDEAPLSVAVADQIAYLRKADRIVTDYVAGLGSRKAELRGPDATKHYEALQKRFEEAFPVCALSYMILYGVYGLVNAKLNDQEESASGSTAPGETRAKG